MSTDERRIIKKNPKYEKYKGHDPFPEITPSLLNSADIIAYVDKIGMIEPFHKTDDDLKPASYALRLLGDYTYWVGEGNKCEGKIKKGDEFTLPKDSIAFVSLEPIIRLPDYIAARFNLKISNVYRGLLLGTGPLVDPGFVGPLSIPLHNLTTNDYKFVGGERLIWMEFTKISPNSRWVEDYKNVNEAGKYHQFDKKPDKNGNWEIRTLSDFIDKAEKQREIQSTIPKITTKAENAVAKAEEVARKNWYINFGVVSVLVILFLAVITMSYRMITLNNTYYDDFNGYQNDLKDIRENQDTFEEQIDSLRRVTKQDTLNNEN